MSPDRLYIHKCWLYFISHFIMNCQKIGVLVMADNGKCNLHGDIQSIFRQISTLFGIYLQYCSSLPMTTRMTHVMQSLFRHNIMFYLYKLLHNVAHCGWRQQAWCVCGDMQSIFRLFAISILFGIYLIMDMGVVT